MIEAVGTRARGLRSHRSEAVEAASAIRRLDWWLVGATAAMLAFGLWAIHGITAHDVTGNPDYFFVRQGIYAAVGVAGAIVLLFIDPQVFRRHKNAIYAGTAGVMALVLVAGTVSRHSKRWLDIGFFRFQPSEFGKLLFVLFLAAFPRRPRQAPRGEPDGARGDRPRLPADPARLRAAGHRHGGTRSTRPRSRQCSSSRACAGRIWPRSGSGRSW